MIIHIFFRKPFSPNLFSTFCGFCKRGQAGAVVAKNTVPGAAKLLTTLSCVFSGLPVDSAISSERLSQRWVIDNFPIDRAGIPFTEIVFNHRFEPLLRSRNGIIKNVERGTGL